MGLVKKISLNTPVGYLPGVGSRQAELFGSLKIATVGDLLRHKPRRWEDFSNFVPINKLLPGKVTIKAQVLEAKGVYTGYRGMHLTEALAQDDSGSLRVIWFNQPYRANTLKQGAWYYMSGVYDLKYRRLQLVNPSVELDSGAGPAKLLKPIYPTTAGLRNAQIIKAMAAAAPALAELEESLPAWMIECARLRPLPRVYEQLHFPQTATETEAAAFELGLRELLALSLASRILKEQRLKRPASALAVKRSAVKRLIDALDFKLTEQQQQITFAILEEMSEPLTPLNRLIQGDVGSGKTLIAALIAFNVITNGGQVAFLAPTQILAQQHFDHLKELYDRLGAGGRLEMLTAGLPAAEKRARLGRIASGEAGLVVGTHALLSDQVGFKKLALAVIDEQHRFGVEQRLKLLDKAEPALANVLTLSATPIPRSLALVLYADLDISLLTEKPPGRRPVKTNVIPFKERAAQLKSLLKGRSPRNKIYVVCPAIDADVEDSLEKTRAYLKGLLPDLEPAVLHARTPAPEKERGLADFRAGGGEVLLCTSIIEAGLDIPVANTIIVMSPERFGLAQLHQLRGRVGRSDDQGYCYLCPLGDQAPSERLEALMKHHSGFKLSEIDLKLRGPGTMYGVRQSGVSAILENMPIGPRTLRLATELATTFIEKGERLDKFPALKKAVADYQRITHLN